MCAFLAPPPQFAFPSGFTVVLRSRSLSLSLSQALSQDHEVRVSFGRSGAAVFDCIGLEVLEVTIQREAKLLGALRVVRKGWPAQTLPEGASEKRS